MAEGLANGLYIIATPIGNLGDISARGVDLLKRVDVILAEDTRMSSRLLNHYGIETPMRPYHDHNAPRVRPAILEALTHKAIALISDAGTPLISDPGYKLVAEAKARGIPVTTAPGPSAFVAALSISGLPSDRFFFAGFAPPKSAGRRRVLGELAHLQATLIFYESPQRVSDFLEDINALMGEREIAVCREITKLHEEVLRGTAREISGLLAARPARGEIVVLIAPHGQENEEGIDLDMALTEVLSSQSLKQAVAQVTAKTGLPRKIVYARALELSHKL